MRIEICANSLESARNAEKAGADRIELCSELAVGGITPSYGLLKAVRESISIPVRVLIRPRSGDFTYSEEVLALMKKDIELCVELGFDGVVTGILNADFTVNTDAMSRMVEAANGIGFTFHRAFDWIKDPYEALPKIAALGVDTILSSGQQKKAIEGLDLLVGLLEKKATSTLMPGSGVTAANVLVFKEKGFEVVHLSAVRMQEKMAIAPRVPMNSPAMLSDVALPISNFEAIREVVTSVK